MFRKFALTGMLAMLMAAAFTPAASAAQYHRPPTRVQRTSHGRPEMRHIPQRPLTSHRVAPLRKR
jgi:hypothetical protein